MNRTSADEEYVSQFGPTNNTWYLLGSFAIVAVYLSICSEGLNSLELYTFGTSYHLMLQRMYRELMMVGLASFMLTILSQSDAVNFTSEFYDSFAFADICCFVMAVFFCLQGIFIMLGSVGQAHIWNVAANISSEELSLNVDRARASFFWQMRYLLFCKTRDQVEFRILRSIFTSAYGISTKLGDLDFGMFLRATHEANILGIIEISVWKWGVILAVVFIVAIFEGQYGKRMKCYASNDLDCGQDNIVLMFTGAGFVITILTLILFYWGRTSELRLFSSCGVNDIDDYTAFLLTEDRAKEIIESNAMCNSTVRQTIAEIMAEQRHLKLQEDIAMQQQSKKLSTAKSFRRVAKKVSIMTSTLRIARDSKVSPVSVNTKSTIETTCSNSSCCDFVSPNNGMMLKVSSSSCSDLDEANVAKIVSSTSEEVTHSMDHSSSNTTSAVLPFTHDNHLGHQSIYMVPEFADMDETDEFASDSPQGSLGGLPESSAEDAKQELSEAGVSLMTTRRHRGNHGLVKELSTGASFRNAIDRIVKEGKRRSLGHRDDVKRTFKNRLRRNFNQQNFRSIFLFGAPQLFYNLIAFVITCNSFYLAWWSTHIVTLAGQVHNYPMLLLLLSLLPALCTLPFLAQAIRSASVLKAITYLNLEIVGTVMDRSTTNATSLEQFRTDFIGMCSRRDKAQPRQAMITICKQYSKDKVALSRSEFADMLLSCGMLYSSEKIKFIFSCIDINGGSTLDMAEFEAFLFNEKEQHVDEYRKSLYNRMNASNILKMGKRDTSRLILESLSPHVKNGIALHRYSSTATGDGNSSQ